MVTANNVRPSNVRKQSNLTDNPENRPISVLIVGCGLGGLSCAISCLREGLDVVIVEKAKELKEIGAGIQLPPNAMRIMDYYGLVEKVIAAGAVELQTNCISHYWDGSIIANRPGPEWSKKVFGHSHYVLHRSDYHRVLYEEACRLGANIRLDCEVTQVNCRVPYLALSTGEKLHASVIIGADGLRSIVRDAVLGRHIDPEETGDLAFRGTIPLELIEDLKDPAVQCLLDETGQRLWLGPFHHAVFYPVRNKTEWNLVLASPDDLPGGTFTSECAAHEMQSQFRGWDPRLTAIISRVKTVLKWKICHMKELDKWFEDSVALLGDSCHPSLPYQAQGAAMAVEDGAVLGVLLGMLSRSLSPSKPQAPSSAVLGLYESLRKQRTSVNVQGAIQNRELYHMPDGPEREARDAALMAVDWDDANGHCKWIWGDIGYQKDLLAFDVVKEARKQFHIWQKKTCNS